MFLPTRLFRKKKNFENKFENILLSEQPSDLLSYKGTLACTTTLAEICELPPQEKKFLKEFDDIFPKENLIELSPFRGIQHQIYLVIGDDFFTASAPRMSEVIIVPKDGYRSHKEQ